ncbi:MULTISPECIES: ABC transporter substrate-binding protein [Streptosporangium]|uniref:ABC-type branched-subunit amino acid transport system substrate-binding protein n=1 Tax=Streptosporangium brasiliense TaxID=47480 RepID=A0ABT9QZ39_9ACTN|nr:ABC transporter substrate-binding protein [Streptosporangium brasiliense]MDP9862241.1 ABC-type branched-subunit amino acid transport system substrate-binding protein [Streptosporangium brasiliense]
MAQPPSPPRTGILTVATLLALTGCGGSAISGGQDGQSGSLKIGVIVPLTGPVSATGTALRRGFELGVKKVNDNGGVNGKKVEYVVVDDAGNPATSTQLARKLIQQDQVSMIFGTITGDTAEAVARVADDAKVPFGTAILGDTERCYTYQWGFGETTRQMLTPAVPELLRKYGTKVAIVGSDYNYPHFYAGVAKELVKQAGGSILAEEYSPLGQADWQPVITRMKDAEPDVVLSMVVGADAVTFSQQAKQFGLLTPELGFEGAPLDTDYYPALSALVNGRTHTVRWTDGLDDAESRKFVADYRAAHDFKDPIPEVAGNAYFGVQFLLDAARKAAAFEGPAINTEIGRLTFDSPLGKGTRFESTNHRLQADMLEVTIKPGGAYEVSKKLGPIPDTTPKTGCA